MMIYYYNIYLYHARISQPEGLEKVYLLPEAPSGGHHYQQNQRGHLWDFVTLFLYSTNFRFFLEGKKNKIQNMIEK